MTRTDETRTSTPPRKWRTVDIIVTAVLGVAFGVVFWAWNLFGTAIGPALDGLGPLRAVLNGVYLVPGVVAGLLIREPGAATFASTIAAVVSVLLGSSFGGIIFVYGFAQGFGAELGFLLTRYRRFGVPVAVLAAFLAGLATSILDVTLYYPTFSPAWITGYFVLTVLSSLVL